MKTILKSVVFSEALSSDLVPVVYNLYILVTGVDVLGGKVYMICNNRSDAIGVKLLII